MEEKLGAGSFQVVGINVMAKDQRLVKAYKREVGFPYPMLAGNTSELLKAYRINYVPVLIFVGRDGIVKKVVGHYIMETELEAVILEIVKDGKQSGFPFPLRGKARMGVESGDFAELPPP